MRHDFGDEDGARPDDRPASGLPEIEEAVTLLCRQPATARFISRRSPTYFVADEPPRGARGPDGADVPATRRIDRRRAARDVPRSRRSSPRSSAPRAAAEKFKDPMQFVISSLRLAYDGKVLTNYRPVVGWLTQLGRAALRTRHAGRLRAHRERRGPARGRWSGASRSPARSAAATRGCSTTGRQQAGAGRRLPDADIAALLRRDRAGA